MRWSRQDGLAADARLRLGEGSAAAPLPPDRTIWRRVVLDLPAVCGIGADNNYVGAVWVPYLLGSIPPRAGETCGGTWITFDVHPVNPNRSAPARQIRQQAARLRAAVRDVLDIPMAVENLIALARDGARICSIAYTCGGYTLRAQANVGADDEPTVRAWADRHGAKVVINDYEDRASIVSFQAPIVVLD